MAFNKDTVLFVMYSCCLGGIISAGFAFAVAGSVCEIECDDWKRDILLPTLITGIVGSVVSGVSSTLVANGIFRCKNPETIPVLESSPQIYI